MSIVPRGARNFCRWVLVPLALTATGPGRTQSGSTPQPESGTGIADSWPIAETAAAEGDWPVLLSTCERLLAASPKDADAQACRLLALVALGEYPRARRALEEFGDAAPTRVVDVAGDVLLTYGDLRGAKRVFERCVEEIQPRNPFCWAGLVRVLLARGEEEEALRRARAALDGGAYPGGLPRLWAVLRGGLALDRDRIGFEKAIGRKIQGCPDLPSLRTPTTSVDLPIRFEKGWPLVPARIEGAPVMLVVDTGSNHVQISRAVAEKIRLRITGTTEIRGVGGGGTAIEERGIAKELRLGGIVFRNVPVTVSDNPIAPGDGVLGAALLRDFLIDFDFPAAKLRLRPSGQDVGAALGPLAPGTSRSRFVSFGGIPLVATRINARMDGWFLIDTGAQSNVFDTRHLHRLRVEGRVTPTPSPDPSTPSRTIGIGGITPVTYVGPLRANLGPYVTDYTHVPAAPLGFDMGVWTLGHWGMELLKDYRMIFDHANRDLYVHSPGVAEGGDAQDAVVPLDLREPELASRLGLR